MSVAAEIVDKQVSLIVANHRGELEASAGRRLDAARARAMGFALLCVRVLRGASTEEALPCITDGGEDLGADAIYLQPDGASFRVTVLQCKLHQEPDGRRNFPQRGVEKAVLLARRLLTAPHRITANPRLQRYLDEIAARRSEGKIPTIRVVLCSNGLPWSAAAQQLIDDAELQPFATFRHCDHHELLRGFSAPPPICDTLQFHGAVVRVDFLGGSMSSGYVAASELARLAEVHGPALNERNLRGFLGVEENPVNRAIAETLRSPEGRQRLVVRNLGVTLVCSALQMPQAGRESPRASVQNLLLLNGAQTMSVLGQARKALAQRHEGEYEPLVAVRLIETGRAELPEELQREITHGNNFQNPVDLKDLHADEAVQRRLELSIAQLGFVYHRRRDEAVLKGRSFGPASLAEAILAIWRGRPQGARAQVADRYNDIYPVVFTEALTGAQAVIAGLIWRLAERLSAITRGRRAALARSGWSCAAMLMGQALLDELQLELGALDHRQFGKAQALVKRSGRRLFDEALGALEKALRAQRRAALDSLTLFESFERGSVLRYLAKPATGAPRRRAAGTPAEATTKAARRAGRARTTRMTRPKSAQRRSAKSRP